MYQLIVLLVIVCVSAVVSYGFSIAFSYIYAWFESAYPALTSLSYVKFFVALNHWQLLLLVLLPALYWFFVNIQKPREPTR